MLNPRKAGGLNLCILWGGGVPLPPLGKGLREQVKVAKNSIKKNVFYKKSLKFLFIKLSKFHIIV